MAAQCRPSLRPGVLAAAGLALAVALSGCGKGAEPPPLVEVKGKVLRASKQPVARVMVIFHPQQAVGSASYRGGTGEDGSFALRCPAGKYRVTVAPLPLKGEATGPAAMAAPGKAGNAFDPHRDPASTPLKAEVPAAGTTDLVLTLP